MNAKILVLVICVKAIGSMLIADASYVDYVSYVNMLITLIT